MSERGPDFFLGSTESLGDFARARAATARARVTGPHDAEYLWVRVEPPVAGQEHGLGDTKINDLIITPHYQGSTLFPVNEFPMPVVIYVSLNNQIFESLRFGEKDVLRVAWGELYQTRDAAAAAAED
jgi:hypothetical protein